MLQQPELAQQHGEHIQAVCTGQQLVVHQLECTVILAGHDGVHHLEHRTLRRRCRELPDLIGMNRDVFAGMRGNLGDFGQQLRCIRTAGEDQEICGMLIAFLAQVPEGRGDKQGQLPVLQLGEYDDTALLFYRAVQLFPPVRLFGTVEKKHGGGGNGSQICNEPVIPLRPAGERRMIPDNHQAAVRQERQCFRGGDQLIGFRGFQDGFIHVLHSFRKNGFPQGSERGLFQIFFFAFEQEDRRDLVPGQGLQKFFPIQDGSPP